MSSNINIFKHWYFIDHSETHTATPDALDISVKNMESEYTNLQEIAPYFIGIIIPLSKTCIKNVTRYIWFKFKVILQVFLLETFMV